MKVLPLPVWKKWKLLDQLLVLEFNWEVIWVEPSGQKKEQLGKAALNTADAIFASKWFIASNGAVSPALSRMRSKSALNTLINCANGPQPVLGSDAESLTRRVPPSLSLPPYCAQRPQALALQAVTLAEERQWKWQLTPRLYTTDNHPKRQGLAHVPPSATSALENQQNLPDCQAPSREMQRHEQQQCPSLAAKGQAGSEVGQPSTIKCLHVIGLWGLLIFASSYFAFFVEWANKAWFGKHLI